MKMKELCDLPQHGYLFNCRHSVKSQKNLQQHRYEKPKSRCVWYFAGYLCLTSMKVTEPCPVTRWRHWRCCVVWCAGLKRGGGWQWLSPGETSNRERQLFLATFTYRFFSFAFTPYCIYLVDIKCVSDYCWAELYHVFKDQSPKICAYKVET
jgi:hypothetical protein